jgi:hypothetical protein
MQADWPITRFNWSHFTQRVMEAGKLELLTRSGEPTGENMECWVEVVGRSAERSDKQTPYISGRTEDERTPYIFGGWTDGGRSDTIYFWIKQLPALLLAHQVEDEYSARMY